MAFRTTNPQGAGGLLNIAQQRSSQAVSQREAELLRLFSTQQNMAQRILQERQQREALKAQKKQKKGFGGAIGAGLGALGGFLAAPATGGASLALTPFGGAVGAAGGSAATTLLSTGLGASLGGSLGGAFDPIGTPNIGGQIGGQLTSLSSYLQQQQIQQNFQDLLLEAIRKDRNSAVTALGLAGSGVTTPFVGPPLPGGF